MTLVEKVVDDIKTRRIDTRKLNKTTSHEYQDYLTELRQFLNDEESTPNGGDQNNGNSRAVAGGGSSGGTSTDGSTSNDRSRSHDGAGTGERSEEPQPKPKPRRPPNLDTADISVPANFPASVNLILAELSRINITIYPNATMDLLRTFLEKSIKSYADNVGVDIRTQQNVSGFVYLSHCLKWLEGYLPTVGHRPLEQVVRKLASGKVSGYYSASTDALNAINHNHKVHAEAEDVRNCWSTMHELMKVVLAP